jgi:hypothetical protein
LKNQQLIRLFILKEELQEKGGEVASEAEVEAVAEGEENPVQPITASNSNRSRHSSNSIPKLSSSQPTTVIITTENP